MSDDLLRWELAAARGRLQVALASPLSPQGFGSSAPSEGPGFGDGTAHVYIAVGLRPETLRTLTRTLTQRLTVAADHLPVVLTDSPSFRLARSAGVVLEYLPDARTWRRHRPGASWDDLLTERLTRIFFDFGCARAVVVDPDCLPTLADLLA